MTRQRRTLLVITATLVVSGCGAPSVQEMVPALSQSQTERDQLPSFEDGTQIQGVDADSTRYLGTTATAEYWVGLDDEQVCLVQSLVGAQAAGSSCADAEDFAETGVGVSSSASGVSATGLLVPHGFDLAEAAAGEDWVRVGDNLAAPADEVE